jgi:DNA mismatch repair protein MutS
MGRRLLRRYLEQPLTHLVVLTKRQDAVEELVQNAHMYQAAGQALTGVYDLERLMTRIVYGSATPRELKSFEQTLERLPDVKASVEGAKAGYLRAVYNGINTMDDLRSLLASALVDEPPAHLKDGGVIRSEYNAELLKLRTLLSDSRGYLAALESRERETTGIKSLKVGFNKVFGYYIEVTKANLTLVPDHYIRKQTLVSSERYITEELKDLENQILSAGERASALEQVLFEALRSAVIDRLIDIQNTAQAIAQLDVYLSFAQVAIESGYCRPELTSGDELIITEGRHPVVEALLKDEPFVPNDTELGVPGKRIAIITGPNMAGKSTYIRQTALIVLLAQIGSFVPAKSARIGLVDGIYTRVGASDDLATGQSTFMVEMREVSAILRGATAQSLLILDEVGRGTSTFDGMSIARAMVEYIADPKKLGAKTLFATHYHELTELEQSHEGVVNLSTAVKKRGDDITFLRRIIPGGADDSYGIEVSKLAGIPEWIITRAKAILSQLEAGVPVSPHRSVKQPPSDAPAQLTLGSTLPPELIVELDRVDPNTLTPIEALNLVYKLKALIKK